MHFCIHVHLWFKAFYSKLDNNFFEHQYRSRSSRYLYLDSFKVDFLSWLSRKVWTVGDFWSAFYFVNHHLLVNLLLFLSTANSVVFLWDRHLTSQPFRDLVYLSHLPSQCRLLSLSQLWMPVGISLSSCSRPRSSGNSTLTPELNSWYSIRIKLLSSISCILSFSA